MSKHTETVTLEINGCELDAEVGFDYQPPEPCVTNPEAWNFGPGCEEEYELNTLSIGLQHVDFLLDHSEIQQSIIDQLKSIRDES